MWALASAWLVLVTYTYSQGLGRTTLGNFYGVLWVVEKQSEGTDDSVYELGHGATRHGAQYMSESRRREPISYYSEESGGGLALVHYARDEDGLRVGVVGLGVGTLATYGQPAGRGLW